MAESPLSDSQLPMGGNNVSTPLTTVALLAAVRLLTM